LLSATALAVLDLSLFAVAVLGYLRGGLWSRPGPGSLEEAFSQLEVSIWSAFPSLPEGYTVREALAHLRKSGFRADWMEIEGSLQAYEGKRFGGLAGPSKFEEVGRLASRLRRHGYFRRD
jgi:hypothetical protein